MGPFFMALLACSFGPERALVRVSQEAAFQIPFPLAREKILLKSGIFALKMTNLKEYFLNNASVKNAALELLQEGLNAWKNK